MSEAQHRLERGRRLLFRALALLVALLAIVLIEGCLRLVGFGDDLALFVPYGHDPGRLAANPDVIQRYFAEAPALRIDAIAFDREKAPDALRFVVQGGSTAAGFPYGRWAGLAGMLGDRIETSFPDREIELISTAMAAVNSYTLLDFVDEIVATRPDAVLVYAGHNEYLGILGAGSAMTPTRLRAATLLHLELRRFRLYQLVGGLVGLGRAALRGADPAAGAAGEGGPLMKRAASAEPIPFGSQAAERGREQFERNLGDILRRYQQAGIPVYVGTLASNEKDLAPFAGGCEGTHGERGEALWLAQREAQAARDVAAEREALSALLDLDDGCADAWYALGQLERAAGDAAAARTAFRSARDRDQLPFRAPAAFNELIRRLAARYGAHLVDVEAALAAASQDGIIGSEVMLEHVHPNARGYFLLADAFFEALLAQGALPEDAGPPSRQQAAADMPITALDRILADHAVRELKASYPFRAADAPGQAVRFPAPGNAIERLAARLHTGEIDWLDAMEGLLQLYRRSGRMREAIVVARMAAQAYPSDSGPNFSAGMLYLEMRQLRRARRYLERSLAASPDHLPTLKALIRTHIGMDDGALARARLDRLAQLAPSDAVIPRFEARLRDPD